MNKCRELRYILSTRADKISALNDFPFTVQQSNNQGKIERHADKI